MTTDSIAIRAATSHDLSAVLAFWRTSAYGTSPTDDNASVAALLARDSAALLLAYDGELIVGSIIAGWDGWRGNLYRLAVLDAYRRREIGAMLVSQAERQLHGMGAQRIGAIVEVDNERGRAFWASQGYQVADSQNRFVKDLMNIVRP